MAKRACFDLSDKTSAYLTKRKSIRRLRDSIEVLLDKTYTNYVEDFL